MHEAREPRSRVPVRTPRILDRSSQQSPATGSQLDNSRRYTRGFELPRHTAVGTCQGEREGGGETGHRGGTNNAK